MSNNRAPGFTLVELLVSLALSGLLIILLNSQITNAIFTDAKIKNQLEYRLKIESIIDQLAADIASASYKPNGQKSVITYSVEDKFFIDLKRFGVSAFSQELTGMQIIWVFDDNGIWRTIKAIDGEYKRLLSSRKVDVNIEKIGTNILKLVIKDDQFIKSKLILI